MKLKSRLFFLFYCLVTTLIAPLGLAFLCYKKRHDPPYGKRALELLGCYHFEFKRCIWFHTVSVGEAIAARPLIQAFVKRHPKLSVVVTTTTTTGAREISKIEGVTHVLRLLILQWRSTRFYSTSNLATSLSWKLSCGLVCSI